MGGQISQHARPNPNSAFNYDPLPIPRVKVDYSTKGFDNQLGWIAQSRPEEIPIGLLEVLPPQVDGKIHVQIRNTNSFDRTYKCLSYVWGSPIQETHIIILNGHEFCVRENLF